MTVSSEILMIVAGISIVAFVFLFYKTLQTKIQYEKRTLFTNAEKKFFKVLDHAVGDIYRVFGKVRIADVLEPDRSLNRKNRNSQFWKISSKHFDYVVCDPVTLEAVCVIELNDKSHEAISRKKRDRFVDEACKSAKLPIVWIPAKMKYDQEKIRAAIFSNISRYRSR